MSDPGRTERVRAEIERYLETAHMTDDERARHFGLPAGCRMRERAKIIAPERLEMGEHVWIGEGVMLDASGGLSIGSHTSIGSGVMIWTHSTALAAVAMRNEIGTPYRTLAPVSIGPGCFISGPSVVMPGVTIGERTMIMPMTVVSRDVPGRVMISGSPPVVTMELTDRTLDAMFRLHGLPTPEEFASEPYSPPGDQRQTGP